MSTTTNTTATTITAYTTAAALLARLDRIRDQYSAAYRHHLARAHATTGATALAWAVQAHAIACMWQDYDQDAWASWSHPQESWYHAQDLIKAQAALHERASAAGPDGHAAQVEASAVIRNLALTPADWQTVDSALDRLANEPAIIALGPIAPPRAMMAQSLGYHWPRD